MHAFWSPLLYVIPLAFMSSARAWAVTVSPTGQPEPLGKSNRTKTGSGAWEEVGAKLRPGQALLGHGRMRHGLRSIACSGNFQGSADVPE